MQEADPGFTPRQSRPRSVSELLHDVVSPCNVSDSRVADLRSPIYMGIWFVLTEGLYKDPTFNSDESLLVPQNTNGASAIFIHNTLCFSLQYS